MSGLDDEAVRPKSAYFVRKTPNQSTSQAQAATSSKTPTSASPLNIAGTRTSLQNNQLLLSPIGIPSIDYFLGGGLPVGSVCLIGQDRNGTYTDIINRCFIAEGVSHKHALYVADLNENADRFFQRIPAVNKIEESPAEKMSDEKLRIAWRYSSQQQKQLPEQQQISHPKNLQPNYFRMDKLSSKEEIFAQCNVKSFDFVEHSSSQEANSIYLKLAQDLSNHIDGLNLNITKSKSYTNVLRIVINSIGSLFYNDQCTLTDDSTHVCRFLLYLRQLMRHSLGVCIVTVPNDIASNKELMEKVSHLADYSFALDDSITTASRITNIEYDGLFRLVKLPRLNSLAASFVPATLDLAFFYRKKRLVVEQMHLPPDIGENDEGNKGRSSTSAVVSCSSSSSSSSSPTSLFSKTTSHNNKLDF